MHHLGYIRHMARFEGIPMPRLLQLSRIASRIQRDESCRQGPVACTLEESITVAYIVYRLLRPEPVNH